MTYGFTQAIEDLQTDTPTPPRWVKVLFAMSIMGATYFLGMTHGLQLGAFAQATGSIPIYIGTPFAVEASIAMPFEINGIDHFDPTAELRMMIGRVGMIMSWFAVGALATVGGWVAYHQR